MNTRQYIRNNVLQVLSLITDCC